VEPEEPPVPKQLPTQTQPDSEELPEDDVQNTQIAQSEQ
jgi:hypothetical protein